MIRRSTALASFAALAAIAAAPLAASADAGNVVGGGGATMTGGGDNTAIVYSGGGAGGGSALLSQPARIAGFSGGHGDGLLVEYLTPAPAGTGRDARLLGGGDNAQVIYSER